jgi:hypothetical protein
MTTTRFFFVGSMMKGMVHYSRIESFVECIENASIKATTYRLKSGFPLLAREGKDLVRGQLVELRATDLLVHLLDEFYGVNLQQPEKGLHFREEVQIISDADQTVTGWVYFANPAKIPKTAEVIIGGDWMASLEANPSFTEALSEKQSNYIQKLGKVSGREIVPIDLTLYRELMKLELIVDKGRRLALSKLGQEVLRYLG